MACGSGLKHAKVAPLEGAATERIVRSNSYEILAYNSAALRTG
jgi:hypothetical protein